MKRLNSKGLRMALGNDERIPKLINSKYIKYWKIGFIIDLRCYSNENFSDIFSLVSEV